MCAKQNDAKITTIIVSLFTVFYPLLISQIIICNYSVTPYCPTEAMYTDCYDATRTCCFIAGNQSYTFGAIYPECRITDNIMNGIMLALLIGIHVYWIGQRCILIRENRRVYELNALLNNSTQ